MKIRDEHLTALDGVWERSRLLVFASRLRQDIPEQVGAIPREVLERQLEEGCRAAKILALTDNEHIYRFLRLRYLPTSVWERNGAQEVLANVLTDTTIEPERRLQFIEKSIAGNVPLAGQAN